ncbi:hypothetical protein DDZ14_01605 [Maritimibacter sp. 55A14]|uniref:hypothetical protein n=1 Tax=Maritimibacter sp. 55A14 TaxID=2174844 RepID=UPI000D616A6C|nr:hypothetical protein [Maritimibacter sp. 55A14]PWE34419.1 hypothetical protein DDZ14_01605 [Maritimibacter sp. 55A14]
MAHLIRSTVLVATLATAAVAETKVSKIDVVVDLSAIETYEAAGAWKSLEADLETAIAERLVTQIADEDADAAEIEIDIDAVALANNFEAAVGIGEWTIVGDVDIDMPYPRKDEDYTLTVTTDQLNSYFPEGTDTSTLTIGSEVYYSAVVSAFADNVASKLK